MATDKQPLTAHYVYTVTQMCSQLNFIVENLYENYRLAQNAVKVIFTFRFLLKTAHQTQTTQTKN